MDRVALILERGRQAQALLDAGPVTEAFDYITDRLQKEWRATAAPMSQHREMLFHQIAALDSVRGQLKRWVEDAKFEAGKLEKENNRLQRRRP